MRTILACALILIVRGSADAQSLGNAGTLQGTIADPSGAVVPNAQLEIKNPLTGYQQTGASDSSGNFRLSNLPPNQYHFEVTVTGFAPFAQDVAIRSSVPVELKVMLKVAGAASSVEVEAAGADLLENVPYAHNDLDRSLLSKLPSTSPGSSLSDAVTFGTPGVVADSNGLFHPLGDHAQTSFVVDGQPISDQQSKQFSTQLPVNAIQSMELITGAANAEYGDKTSLVVNATTRSGLGQKTNGGIVGTYGSFGTASEEANLGTGNAKFGNYVVFNALRSGRFLDTPEFRPIHAVGNNGTLFDRIDYQPDAKDAFHLNLFGARNWFQIPNTYDQPAQDQRQRVGTWSIAPGYQHTFSSSALLTVNPFFRQDNVHFFPSADFANDTPATLSQQRRLTNWGVRTDFSYVAHRNDVKIGTQITQTLLKEAFALGVTDALFNALCVDTTGDPQAALNIGNPKNCSASRLLPNPNFIPGLLPFDLSRGGVLFQFSGAKNIDQQAYYVQDQFTLGPLSLSSGLRIDHYVGFATDTGVQPRMGASYLIKPTGTVLRVAYSRAFETPYNENLIVSSSTGAGGIASGVFGALGSAAIQPGRRNQYNAGIQQSLHKYLLVDVDYFWKHTDNAYDFDSLFSTPIQFPISWRQSKLDGISIRLSTPNIHGFQAMTNMGHTRARFFGPEIGGLLFNSPVDSPVFRIDHDEAFEQTTNFRYQFPHTGPWVAFTWRYDSGAVAGAVTDEAHALALTAAEQAAIGFYCGSVHATLASPITACSSANFGADRLHIPAAGTENADTNPPRIAPRNLLDFSAGTDNLFRTEKIHTTLRFTVTNLTNEIALYNFLSTFSGTHFVTPRGFQASAGVSF